MAAALYTSPSRWAKPTIAVIPAVARATSSMAAWFWSRNSGRKRRSSGGYPVSVSSGNATRSAPRSRARAIVSMTFLAFPGRSPTVGFTWASASRTIRSDRSPAGESLWRSTATMVPRRTRRFHRFESGPKGCHVGAIRHEEPDDGEKNGDTGGGRVREQPERRRKPELYSGPGAGSVSGPERCGGPVRRLLWCDGGGGRGRAEHGRGGPGLDPCTVLGD